jgi:hypothetical protein
MTPSKPVNGRPSVLSSSDRCAEMRERDTPGMALEARYMPDELLLTMHDRAGGPVALAGDERVRALLHKAEAVTGVTLRIAGGGRSRLPGATSRTLRLHIEAPGDACARDRVPAMVGCLGRSLAELRIGSLAVSSAMPNWIVRSSQTTWHPGPASAPEPAPEGAWQFEVPAAGREPADEPPKRVIVAVLDTSPGWEGVQAAAGRMAFAGNALLQRVASGEAVKDWDEFSPPPAVPANLQGHTIADHGLFVAGIVNSIAPQAEVHLLHVLDDQGLGRTDLLLDALDYCRYLAQGGTPVVVNLSLYLMMPPRDDLAALQARPASRFVKHPLSGLHGVTLRDRLLDAVAVREMIHMLLNDGAVIVAAAGNDALAAKRHLPERPPADYQGVIGVVATDRDGKLAAYSNRADAGSMHVSVATYGGQGVVEGDCVVVPPGDPRDGVVGLYTRERVNACGDSPPNVTGWAYWSGTSFATPIVSALAANTLAREPGLSPGEVGRRILAMAKPAGESDPNLGCPYIRVTQHR